MTAPLHHKVCLSIESANVVGYQNQDANQIRYRDLLPQSKIEA